MAKVKTRCGLLDGTEERGAHAFLGIPYAKPPVGDRRWRAPEPLDESDDVVSCKSMGYTARQVIDEVEPASLREQSEDCLTLNVWVRDLDSSSKPVMVYIHGGAYFSGGSSDPLYNGAAFARNHDVVLVSINYRLNVFGSLQLSALPGGEEYREAGYLNLLDQVAALKWVRDNIEAFGGDKDRVTLFGESAGSASAALLAVTPSAAGLFKRVICESGPIQLYKTPEKASAYAREFATSAGCSTAQELAAKSSDEITDAMAAFCEKHRFETSLMFAPVCDGNFVPRKPMAAWRKGAAAGVDVMIGSTEDEFNYFSFYFKPEDMPGFWHGQTPFHFDDLVDIEEWEQKWKEANPGIDFLGTYTEFMNQTGFRVGADMMAEQQSAVNDTYNYLFRYKSRCEGMGACHAIELPFVFDALDNQSVADHITGPGAPQHLADEMGDVWYNFAATGKPFAEGLPEWPAFTKSDHAYMVMDENGWCVRRDINKKNNELFAGMYSALIEGDEY